MIPERMGTGAHGVQNASFFFLGGFVSCRVCLCCIFHFGAGLHSIFRVTQLSLSRQFRTYILSLGAAVVKQRAVFGSAEVGGWGGRRTLIYIYTYIYIRLSKGRASLARYLPSVVVVLYLLP